MKKKRPGKEKRRAAVTNGHLMRRKGGYLQTSTPPNEGARAGATSQEARKDAPSEGRPPWRPVLDRPPSPHGAEDDALKEAYRYQLGLLDEVGASGARECIRRDDPALFSALDARERELSEDLKRTWLAHRKGMVAADRVLFVMERWTEAYRAFADCRTYSIDARGELHWHPDRPAPPPPDHEPTETTPEMEAALQAVIEGEPANERIAAWRKRPDVAAWLESWDRRHPHADGSATISSGLD